MHEGIRAERVKDSIVKGNFALQFSRGNYDVYSTTLRRGPLLCAHLNFGDQKTGSPEVRGPNGNRIDFVKFQPEFHKHEFLARQLFPQQFDIFVAGRKRGRHKKQEWWRSSWAQTKRDIAEPALATRFRHRWPQPEDSSSRRRVESSRDSRVCKSLQIQGPADKNVSGPVQSLVTGPRSN